MPKCESKIKMFDKLQSFTSFECKILFPIIKYVLLLVLYYINIITN